VSFASASDDAIVWTVLRAPENAPAAPDGAQDEDGAEEADHAASGIQSEHDSDEESEGVSGFAASASAAALQDDDPFAELDAAARPVQERREGSDTQTDAFRERLVFADAQLTLEAAQARYRELRRGLARPYEVRVALRQSSDGDAGQMANQPQLRVAGASCSCGRPALCGYPCLHIWLALASALERHSEPRCLADDRVFTADLVSYEEARHLLCALCASRWFHPSVSGDAVLPDRSEPSTWPPSPPARRSAPEGAHASPAAATMETLRQEVEDMLAAGLVHHGERTRSRDDLVRARSLAAETLAALTGEAELRAMPDAATPAGAHPPEAPLGNPAALRTGKRKRSPQKVDLSLGRRRRGSGQGRKAARRRL
jgi:hypothetical protein